MEIFQDLNIAIPVIQKYFSKNPNASICAIYKTLRRRQSLSLFGDFPIISIIVTTMQDLGVPARRRLLLKTFKQSEELRGKILLLDQLLSDKITHKDLSKMSYNKWNSGETTIASSRGVKYP